MITVYVSGPFSSNPMGNTLDAIRVGDRLIDHGFAPFVPHSHYFWWDQAFGRSYDDWMAQCLEWVGKCDCVLRIPGESSGSDRETFRAKVRGLPVFYSERELFNWRDALLAANAGSK